MNLEILLISAALHEASSERLHLIQPYMSHMARYRWMLLKRTQRFCLPFQVMEVRPGAKAGQWYPRLSAVHVDNDVMRERCKQLIDLHERVPPPPPPPNPPPGRP